MSATAQWYRIFLIWISFLSVLLIHVGSRIVLTDCEAVLRFDGINEESIILFVFIKGSRFCEISIRIRKLGFWLNIQVGKLFGTFLPTWS